MENPYSTTMRTWGAPTWSMRPEGRSALEATLTCLSQQIPEGFAFRAAWVGDKIHREVEVSRGALTELVRASRLNGWDALPA